MAQLMGYQGEVQFDDGATAAIMASIDSWTLNLKADVLETTDFDADQTEGKTFEYGLRNADGSCSGTLDTGGVQEDMIDWIIGTLPIPGGTHASAKFILVTGESLDCGKVLTSNITTGGTVAGKQTFSMDFTCSENGATNAVVHSG